MAKQFLKVRLFQAVTPGGKEMLLRPISVELKFSPSAVTDTTLTCTNRKLKAMVNQTAVGIDHGVMHWMWTHRCKTGNNQHTIISAHQVTWLTFKLWTFSWNGHMLWTHGVFKQFDTVGHRYRADRNRKIPFFNTSFFTHSASGAELVTNEIFIHLYL